jgi:cell division protein ZapE
MPVDIPVSSRALPQAVDATEASGPEAIYRERCREGLIRPDPAQEHAVARLQQLHEALRQYQPESGRLGWLARLARLGQEEAPPKGLYLWGPVGRGKSMLMDLLFAAAPVTRKQRVHFHAFMLDVHDRIERERREKTREPVGKVAADLAEEATLLCFDEFQVNDIADAMILERLFRALYAAGTVVVATSNRRPDRLYENGLQRDRFLPFIAFLQQHLDTVELDSGRDYRLARMRGKKVYHWPDDAAARTALETAFADLTDHAEVTSDTLTILARPLVVPRVGRNVAWFSFEELCARPLAAADYLAIAERYAAIIVEGIPRLAPQQRNEAQRFHILIDALYEARTLLVASAEVPPDQLYVEGDGSWEFERTVSRLIEMQSEDYLANRRV